MMDLMLKPKLTGAKVLALPTPPRYFQNTDESLLLVIRFIQKSISIYR